MATNWVRVMEETLSARQGTTVAEQAEAIRRAFVAHELVVADAGWLADRERALGEAGLEAARLQALATTYADDLEAWATARAAALRERATPGWTP